jgi:phosphate transport system permease protein
MPEMTVGDDMSSENLDALIPVTAVVDAPTSTLELSRIPSARRAKDRLFGIMCLAALGVAALMLIILLAKVASEGAGRLSLDFLTSKGSRNAAKAGVFPALIGSLWIVALSGFIAVPIGVAAAIYLEEFQRRKTKLTSFIQLNIANLAGVPSIVYGLLGLGLFVYVAQLGRSVISGALTMSLLILPTIILIAQEALKAVPSSYRDGSLALGATRWQTIRRQVLPAAMPSIYTGIILSLSRAIGETAPLITVGAATYMSFAPKSPTDKFTVLPIQIFDWANRPGEDFQRNAAAAILVLMVVLLGMNSIAIFLRSRARAKR